MFVFIQICMVCFTQKGRIYGLEDHVLRQIQTQEITWYENWASCKKYTPYLRDNSKDYYLLASKYGILMLLY